MSKVNPDRLLNEIETRRNVKSFGEEERAVSNNNETAISEMNNADPDTSMDVRVGSGVTREPVYQRAPKLETNFSDLSPTAQSLWGSLDNYVAGMRPQRPIPLADMIDYQRKFVIWCERVTSLPEDREFMILLTRFMDLIQEHRTNGCFSPEYTFRVWKEIKLQDSRLARASNFIGMMRNFADPKARPTLIQRYPVDEHSAIAGVKKERLSRYIHRISGK